MRFLCILIILVFLSGCAANENSFVEDKDLEYIFSIDKELQDSYQDKIEKLLDDLYWKYDKNTIFFSEEAIINKNDNNYTDLVNACNDIDTDIQKYSNDMAIIAQIELLHVNNDIAGSAKFYFIDNNIVGGYYIPEYNKQLVVSLKQRNIFTENVKFERHEDKNVVRTFTEQEADIPLEGFHTTAKNQKGEVIIASIADESVHIYKYAGNKFINEKNLNFSNNLIPMSVVFLENIRGIAIAVLLGELTYLEGSEEYEAKVYSKKVVFFDPYYNKLRAELELDYTNSTTLFFDEDFLISAAADTLYYYNYSNNKWNKDRQITLSHSVKYINKVDLDDSKEYEYVITDGLDLYLYDKNNKSFNLLWRTHFGRQSYRGPIYCADLNGDGVKEIYIGDQTSTTIRYIVSKLGLISYNEDILFGQRIFASDFNGDGKDDYIKVTDGETNEQRLYIAN